MIAILDYGSGNIRSAKRAFEKAGLETVVTTDPELAAKAAGLVIPGVGAFTSCINQLRAIGGDQIIKERVARSKPILGICVGMQILFESSEENEPNQGLALLPGRVKRLDSKILPQIGWNTVEAGAGSILFKGVEKERFYFVHSYAATQRMTNAVTTTCEYGEPFLAGVEFECISAIQFHPEKSGIAGIKLLKNWAESI